MTVVRVDHERAGLAAVALLRVPSQVAAHADYTAIFVPREERVLQRAIQHVDQLVDGREEREVRRLQRVERLRQAELVLQRLLIFLERFDQLKELLVSFIFFDMLTSSRLTMFRLLLFFLLFGVLIVIRGHLKAVVVTFIFDLFFLLLFFLSLAASFLFLQVFDDALLEVVVEALHLVGEHR